MSIDRISGDRRRDRRYSFELPLSFQYTLGREVGSSFGQTVDLSHGGIRFVSEAPPPAGADVEARIAWPFLLQGVCPLELVVRGFIHSVSSRGAVLLMRSYEFQTCGARSFAETPQPLGEFRVA